MVPTSGTKKAKIKITKQHKGSIQVGHPQGFSELIKKTTGIVKINKEILKNPSAILLMTLKTKINSRIEQKLNCNN